MLLIHNGTIVNEGSKERGYLVIHGKEIMKVGSGDVPKELLDDSANDKIDAAGGYIIPGVIDDQVHFREPGLCEKGDIHSESRAAVAGGVTSFMEMPNTNPPAITIDQLESKFERAAEVSVANYSFYLGASNSNIDQVRAIDPKKVCGVKLFMGSSTGNMLVDKRMALEAIFAESPVLVATHCEDETIVRANMEAAKAKWGEDIPFSQHPIIRSQEACYRSSALAVELADKHGADLHILHLSTARELSLFSDKPLSEKKITAEVCAHHLWFADDAYDRLGAMVKCNPAVKTAADREALRVALKGGKLDVVATDHAPHTLAQKQGNYIQAPSGLPLVQHSLGMMLEMDFAVEDVVRWMCHNPAERFKVSGRGFLREGYYADVAIVRPENWKVSKENIMYKCAWSPLEGESLRHKVSHTIINGKVVYCEGVVVCEDAAMRLDFA